MKASFHETDKLVRQDAPAQHQNDCSDGVASNPYFHTRLCRVIPIPSFSELFTVEYSAAKLPILVNNNTGQGMPPLPKRCRCFGWSKWPEAASVSCFPIQHCGVTNIPLSARIFTGEYSPAGLAKQVKKNPDIDTSLRRGYADASMFQGASRPPFLSYSSEAVATPRPSEA